MRKADTEKHDTFWTKVRHAEHDVLKEGWRGHVPPDYLDRGWDEDFAKAYDEISDSLKNLSKPQLFAPPPNLKYAGIPFRAQNAHEALMYILNPPELLYGEWGVFESHEYRQIKQQAMDELKRVQEKNETKPSLPKTVYKKVQLIGLQSELMRRHFDFGNKSQPNKPFTQKQIGEFMGWPQVKVCRYMKLLFKHGGMKEYVGQFRGNLPPKGYRKTFDDLTSHVEAIEDVDLS